MTYKKVRLAGNADAVKEIAYAIHVEVESMRSAGRRIQGYVTGFLKGDPGRKVVLKEITRIDAELAELRGKFIEACKKEEHEKPAKE